MPRTPKPTAIAKAQLQATRTLSAFITAKSGLSNIELEEELAFLGSPAAKEKTGNYWARMLRGQRAVGQDNLARIAHQAILRGWLTPDELVELELAPGGWRAVRPVRDLLLRMERGEVLSRAEIDEHCTKWISDYRESSARITAERNELQRRCTAVSTVLYRASHAVEELMDAILSAHSHDVDIDTTIFAAADPCDDEDDPHPAVDRTMSEFKEVSTRLVLLADNIGQAALREARYGLGLNDLPPVAQQAHDVEVDEAVARSDRRPGDVRQSEDELSAERLFLRWIRQQVDRSAATGLPQTAVETSRLQSTPRTTKVK